MFVLPVECSYICRYLRGRYGDARVSQANVAWTSTGVHASWTKAGGCPLHAGPVLLPEVQLLASGGLLRSKGRSTGHKRTKERANTAQRRHPGWASLSKDGKKGCLPNTLLP